MPAVPQSRRRRVVVLVAAAVLIAPAPADAALRLCRQLEAALAQTGGGGMGRAYDRAIAAQADAIARTQARLSGSSCSPSFFGQGNCDRLRATLRDMQRNLVSLRRTRAGLGGSSGRAERSRLLASLEANGCRADKPPEPVQAEVAEPENPDAMQQSVRRPRRLGGEPVCVRTCDGYFFPMTRTIAPVEDQTVCEAACPGTPMEVFYRRSGADAESMISGRNNLPYARLETANLFRDADRPRPPGCGCNAAKSRQVMSKPRQGTVPDSTVTPDLSDADADPMPEQSGSGETRSPPASASGTPAERKVRVVGPTFLPAPEAAEARPVPAPTPPP